MPQRHLSAFRADEDGAMTALNLFFVLVMALLGGLAIDMGHLVSERTQMQVAADSAAQAAIVTRERSVGAGPAKAKALELAAMNMPADRFGTVLRPENIQFGTWDRTTRTFTADDANAKDAVYVKVDQLEENSNGVSSFLLRLIGFSTFDVVVESVFETYRPTCLREGFVAQDMVDIQSGNVFTNGFCIHSNTNVSLNQNNTFDQGTIVSMPNSEAIELPSSGFEKNEGLEAALRNGAYWIDILRDLANGTVEADILAGTPDGYSVPGLDTTVVNINMAGNTKLDMATLHAEMDDGDPATLNDGANHIYEVGCGNNNRLTLESSEPFKDVVIMTDCEIIFENAAELHNTTILTRDTSANSVKSPAGLTIGLDDDCADGGGAQILTMGGISQASGVSMFGGRIIALDTVKFAANNDGLHGASVISGGRIELTAGSVMGFCGTGMTDTFETRYYRMAG